ncbi:MAG: DoxX family protein [Arachnia propionica]|uniref:DoxX family protein n=1 Tax=Arachnia propionica TaxID=1750 RepID=UPI00270BFA72|nr:DoxX family protein [Arachnia propionica]
MKAFIRVVKDIALMLTRIVMGVVMVAHGWHRWQNEGVSAEAALLESLGLPNPGLIIWLVIGFEVIGGILLIFGLATPLVGLGLMVLNITIIILVRSEHFYAHDDGWEYNAVMAVVGLMLLAHGSGRAGLDNLFIQPRDDEPDQEEQEETATMIAEHPTP